MSLYKIVILGEGGVGKSCITIQLVKAFFVTAYDPTIVDEDTVQLDILDTAGQEEYAAMRDQHIMQGRGFVLVYSITTRSSFLAMKELHRNILRVQDVDTFPVVVCGNQCDLENKRAISYAEGKEFAESIDAPFFETSAKLRINVEEAFVELVRHINKWEAANPSPDKNHQGNSEDKETKNKKWCILL